MGGFPQAARQGTAAIRRGQRRKRVERFDSTYGIGDKMMQVENDYDKEVYNGDLGVVRSIDSEAAEMVIEFDGRAVAYGVGDLDEVALASAMIIPQEPELGICGVRHSADDAALSDAASQSLLHRRHPRQEAGRHRRAEEGDGDRGEGEADQAAAVEAEGEADR